MSFGDLWGSVKDLIDFLPMDFPQEFDGDVLMGMMIDRVLHPLSLSEGGGYI